MKININNCPRHQYSERGYHEYKNCVQVISKFLANAGRTQVSRILIKMMMQSIDINNDSIISTEEMLTTFGNVNQNSDFRN